MKAIVLYTGIAMILEILQILHIEITTVIGRRINFGFPSLQELFTQCEVRSGKKIDPG